MIQMFVKIFFDQFTITFMCDIKIDLMMYRPLCVKLFLGGLSLHLNHLLACPLGIGNLGHLPPAFFGQIFTQDTLRHILGPFLVHFEIFQFLETPLAIFQKWVPSQNQIFLHEGVTSLPCICLV